MPPGSDIQAPVAHAAKAQLQHFSGRAPVDHQRLACCNALLNALASPDTQIGTIGGDKEEAGKVAIFMALDDPLIIGRYQQEMRRGVDGNHTQLARALRDVGSVLPHYFSIDGDVIRYSRLVQAGHSIDPNLPDAQSIHAYHNTVREWLAMECGVAKAEDGRMILYMRWPHMTEPEQWLETVRAHKDDLMRAVDGGLLEIADAATYQGHGFAPTGYGRA